MDVPDDLAATIRTQWGLLTRCQAREAGLSDAAVRWALSRGWESVLPGVLHVDRSPLRVSQRMLAGLLYAGPEAAVAGLSAAWWYGLTHVPRPGPIQIDVPAPARSREVRWAVMTRTKVPEGCIRVRGPLRFVSPERAVVGGARADLGREATQALVIEAVQRRLCSVDRLAHVNETMGRRDSARVRAAIRAAAVGVWSMPELGLARLLESSRVLPTMWANPKLSAESGEALISPDGWCDDVGLALMVHSVLHHDGPGFETTVEADGELASHAVTVLGLTPRGIENAPDQALARVERAYVALRQSGRRPRVRATPRTAWVRLA